MVLAVAVLALTATVAAACGSSPGPTSAPTSTTVVYGTGDLAQVYCTPTGIGTQEACGGLVPAPAGVTDRIALDKTTVPSGTVIHGALIVDNRSGNRIALLDPRGCQPSMAVALTSATMAPVVGFRRGVHRPATCPPCRREPVPDRRRHDGVGLHTGCGERCLGVGAGVPARGWTTASGDRHLPCRPRGSGVGPASGQRQGHTVPRRVGERPVRAGAPRTAPPHRQPVHRTLGTRCWADGSVPCPPMELRLDGRTALVTGGSRGIGQAIARTFADAGASVMISSRSAEGLEASATEIRSQLGGGAGEVDWSVANAGDPDQAEASVAATVDRFGTLDVLVNNAATNPYYGPIIEIDRGRADKTVRVNQSGYLEWTQAAWRAGMADHGGAVLNIASIGGMAVEGGIGWYNVTKAAVIHLTSQLAGELGPAVRVNAIAPGLVKTQLAKALWEPGEERIARRLPSRRLGIPEDIANAALFLCSEAASWITGETLVVDGGSLCMATGSLS